MTTPLTWITDRPPTRADADTYGDVVIATNGGWDIEKWHNVPDSRPWIAFKPPSADPAPAAATTSQPRRIVSITESDGTVMAAADDGTAWLLSSSWASWTQLPALPQREAEELL